MSPGQNGQLCHTRTEALQASQAALAPYLGGAATAGAIVDFLSQPGNVNAVGQWRVLDGVNNTLFWRTYDGAICPEGQIENSITGQCMDRCSTRGDVQYAAPLGTDIPSGSISCESGCQVAVFPNQDGSATGVYIGDEPNNHCNITLTDGQCDDFEGYSWVVVSTGTYCMPPPKECGSGQVKDAKTGNCETKCPDGMSQNATGACVKKGSTCPAGQVQGPDGSCVNDACPAGQTKGSDGSCKKDGDPNKDEGDDDKYFSGGDDCNAPPACSGDEIMCGQARIQWRIDCNTRHNTNVSGGNCGSVPTCSGDKCDALQFAQLLQQWRTACALERMANTAQGSGDGEQPSWTRVDGMNQNAGQGETAADQPHVATDTVGVDDLDSSGFLGGMGSCPAIMTVAGGTGFGNSFAQALASPPPYFCNFIGAMAALVMLGASIVSALILTKG